MKFNTHPNCVELIKQGKCKADCCGVVPIMENYWKILKKFAVRKDYKIFKFKYCGDKFVKALTSDFKCVFLKDDFSCAIHNSNLRSDVCKKYGLDENEPLLACPHINEDKKDFISDYADNKLKQLAKMADPAAVEYLSRKYD